MPTTISGTSGVSQVQPGVVTLEDLAWTPPFTKEYISPQQTLTAAGLITVAHGLGAVPKVVTFDLVCVTTDGTYSAGDIIPWMTVQWNTASTSVSQGFTARKSATEINVRVGNSFVVQVATSAAVVTLTMASWRLVIGAWA